MLQMDPQKAYDIVEWIALETILKELGFPKKNYKMDYAYSDYNIIQI